MTIVTQQSVMPAFVFSDSLEDRELFRIQRDGKVIKNDNVSWDDCAKTFWEAVENAFQGAVRGDRDAFIRVEERERIVKALENCKLGTPDSPYIDEDIIRGLEWAIAIVRGDV
jgi:hypothetical protein